MYMGENIVLSCQFGADASSFEHNSSILSFFLLTRFSASFFCMYSDLVLTAPHSESFLFTSLQRLSFDLIITLLRHLLIWLVRYTHVHTIQLKRYRSPTLSAVTHWLSLVMDTLVARCDSSEVQNGLQEPRAMQLLTDTQQVLTEYHIPYCDAVQHMKGLLSIFAAQTSSKKSANSNATMQLPTTALAEYSIELLDISA